MRLKWIRSAKYLLWWVCKKLLDCIQYCENIYDKNILENSCGDGNILAVIVERYIDDAKAHGLSNQQIKKVYQSIYMV